ncbi:MAG: hypothetical protein Q7R66_12485, partial [Undibacterium sp.]|uniref:hypothetical protein n=1 Tax=Undibacterium sp. TaxID=1914977 RepID=UPI002715D7CE
APEQICITYTRHWIEDRPSRYFSILRIALVECKGLAVPLFTEIEDWMKNAIQTRELRCEPP